MVADRECHKGVVGRELSEARIALVEADMIDVGYRRDRFIDHKLPWRRICMVSP
jgi:hypothetical protein